jgi:hypothetical protein
MSKCLLWLVLRLFVGKTENLLSVVRMRSAGVYWAKGNHNYAVIQEQNQNVSMDLTLAHWLVPLTAAVPPVYYP